MLPFFVPEQDTYMKNLGPYLVESANKDPRVKAAASMIDKLLLTYRNPTLDNSKKPTMKQDKYGPDMVTINMPRYSTSTGSISKSEAGNHKKSDDYNKLWAKKVINTLKRQKKFEIEDSSFDEKSIFIKVKYP